MVKLIITENEADQRLDRFLRKYLKRTTLGSIYKMIRKDVKVNGKRAGEETMLCAGDELTLYISEDQLKKMTGTVKNRTARRQFRIAYEDENLLIVEKPEGLLIHGDSREKKNTLMNQVCGYLQEKGEYDPAGEKTFTPSPVNRLDRNTTGLVIFGKSAEALRAFTKFIRERELIDKYYLTIVAGRFMDAMTLQGNLNKDESTNISSVVSPEEGREAVTEVRPVITGQRFSLVEVRLITGRTHQIRVHLSHAGFPLVGDGKYGNGKVNRMAKQEFGVTTQLLHAYKLVFGELPGTFAYLSGKVIECPEPEDFTRVKNALVI
ncbi:MAG: RluA family pseudouridine synthase [Bacillota bacterium]|nr:RluA family pseudouridine synthase [Bacillota bacterium]